MKSSGTETSEITYEKNIVSAKIVWKSHWENGLLRFLTIKKKTHTHIHARTHAQTKNPGERGESDFQSYHITIFKYLVFNNNTKSQDIQTPRKLYASYKRITLDIKA